MQYRTNFLDTFTFLCMRRWWGGLIISNLCLGSFRAACHWLSRLSADTGAGFPVQTAFFFLFLQKNALTACEMSSHSSCFSPPFSKNQMLSISMHLTNRISYVFTTDIARLIETVSRAKNTPSETPAEEYYSNPTKLKWLGWLVGWHFTLRGLFNAKIIVEEH